MVVTGTVIITAIATIASALAPGAMTAATLYQQVLGQMNGENAIKVKNLINSITNAIRKKKIDNASLIAALQTKDAQQISGLLYANPVIARNASDITKDSVSLNSIAAKLSAKENEIAELTNSLNNSNYASSHSEAKRNAENIDKLETQLNSAKDQYNTYSQDLRGIKDRQSNVINPKAFEAADANMTSISQNIKGGTK